MLWVKMFHILFVMSWLAGIFYLPRLFVHFKEGTDKGEDVSRLKIMASKLFKFSTIMMVLALFFGMWLWLGFNVKGEWLYYKLGFVLLLVIYHLINGYLVKKVNQEQLAIKSLYLKIYNEFAVLFLVLPILIFVVVKPTF